MLEENHSLPLVDIQVSLRTGSVHDPLSLLGLSRTTALMIRMGTRSTKAPDVDQTIDSLGAHLSIQCAPSFIHFSGVVVERNLESFVALLGELLLRPAFRSADLDFIKREIIADLREGCDNDRVLALRHFRRFILRKHPYGRPVVGTQASIRAIQRKHIIDHYKQHYLKQNMVIGASGAVSEKRLRTLVDRYLGDLASGRAPKEKLPVPRLSRGRHALIVDKPERTQTQILIGTLGARVSDPDYTPLLVGNMVFGGTFTARLMNEIRSKRGWSYGASSNLSLDRQRDLWSMWTFPAAENAVACIDLQLSLFERLIDRGITEKELRFAKRYLTKSHAFNIDTAAKRLSESMDTELFNLAPDFYINHIDRIREVTRVQVNEALQKRLSKRNMAIVMVATAAELIDQISSLSGVKEVQTVPFDLI